MSTDKKSSPSQQNESNKPETDAAKTLNHETETTSKNPPPSQTTALNKSKTDDARGLKQDPQSDPNAKKAEAETSSKNSPHGEALTQTTPINNSKTTDAEALKKGSATDADPPVPEITSAENKTASTHSSPPNSSSTQIRKQPETDHDTAAHGGSTSDADRSPKKISKWKKLRNLLCLQKGKKSEPKPSVVSQRTEVEEAAQRQEEMQFLSKLIQADIDYIRKREKDHGHFNKHIDSALTEASKHLKECKGVEALRRLRKGMMLLKLRYFLNYKSDTDVKDPHKNLWLGFLPKRRISEGAVNILHKSDVFETSVEFKDFEVRYNELSLDLKLCLLCFSVFPEEAIIKKRLMVQWWVAEGYASCEDEANENFNQLIDKGFIEPVNKKRSLSVGSCKMHSFNRSALVILAERAKFFNFSERGEPTQNFSGSFQACLVGKGLISYEDLKRTDSIDHVLEELRLLKEKKSTVDDLEKELKEAESTEDVSMADFQEKLHLLKENKLTIDDWEKKLKGNKLAVVDLGKLHLLINVNEHILDFKPEWFSEMTNLNFLYLGRWKVSAEEHIEVEDPKFLDKLESMSFVKFLSLQGVSNVIVLPKSILQLTNLNFLDLRACYNLETIPERIEFLKNLTHLDMTECYLLDHMPKSLSSLEKLEVLKGFVVRSSDEEKKRPCCTLGDLGKLKKLIKLCIYTGLEKFPDDDDGHVTALGKLEVLRKLTITWGVITSPRRPTDKQNSNNENKEDNPTAAKSTTAEKQQPRGSSKSPINAGSGSPTGRLPPKLEKLDLKCCPASTTPYWLQLNNLKDLNLKKLYIRGGKLSDLGQYQDIGDRGFVQPAKKETWKVEVLRLKYLSEIEMEWRQLRELFPRLVYLEQVSCPKLTLFRCDANGVWINKTTSSEST